MSSNSEHKTRASIVVIIAVVQLLIVIINPRAIPGFVIAVIPLWFAAVSVKMGEVNSVINYIAAGAVLLSVIITPSANMGSLIFLYILLCIQLFTIMCGTGSGINRRQKRRKCVSADSRCINYKPCNMCKRKH